MGNIFDSKDWIRLVLDGLVDPHSSRRILKRIYGQVFQAGEKNSEENQTHQEIVGIKVRSN